MGWCTPSMQEMCLLSNVLDMCETKTSMTKHSYPTLFKIVVVVTPKGVIFRPKLYSKNSFWSYHNCPFLTVHAFKVHVTSHSSCSNVLISIRCLKVTHPCIGNVNEITIIIYVYIYSYIAVQEIVCDLSASGNVWEIWNFPCYRTQAIL